MTNIDDGLKNKFDQITEQMRKAEALPYERAEVVAALCKNHSQRDVALLLEISQQRVWQIMQMHKRRSAEK